MSSAPDGFGPEAEQFFAGLEADNSRAYFTGHRDLFDRAVAEPMAALLDSLPARYHPFKTFRMNRDVRFSRDKSPYKTAHAAVHSDRGVDHYLHVEAGRLLAATGAYLWAPDQLERYRLAVVDDHSGPELERLVAELRRRRSLEVGPGGAEPLKTAPRGYSSDHPRIELLRWKGLIGSRTLTTPRLARMADVRRFVVDTFEMCDDVNGWIAAHVGPSELPTRR